MDVAQELMNLKLVKEVGKYPCLYKTDITEYSRRSITDKAWADVARVVGWPAPKCKYKFRNIRAVVARYKRVINNGGVKKRPYYLLEHMHYAFPYIKSFNEKPSERTEGHSDTDPLLAGEEIDYLADESLEEVKVETYDGSPCMLQSCPESPPSSSAPVKYDCSQKIACSKDNPHNNETNTSEQRVDLIDTSMDLPNALQNDSKKMFLLSLLPDVYAMNDKQTRKFKREVLQLVDDILIES